MDVWQKHKRGIIAGFAITLAICLLGMIAPGVFGSGVTQQDLEIARQYQTMAAAQGYQQLVPYFDLGANAGLYHAVETIRYSMVQSDALRSFLFIAAALCVILLQVYRKIPVWATCSVVGILVLCDLYSVNKRYLSHDSFCTPELTQGEMFPMSDNDREILKDTAMNYRVMDIPNFSRPAPSYRHKMIGGYHAAKLTRYQDLISEYLGKTDYYPELKVDSIALRFRESDPQTMDRLLASYRILDMLNARYIIDSEGKLHHNPDALGNAWFIDNLEYVDDADQEMAALAEIDPSCSAVADKKFQGTLGEEQPARAPGDTIYETSYAPNRLSYHARSKNGGTAVFSEVYFPWGWHAAIDGQPAEIARVNYLLRGMRIPAGTHEIEMKFDPKSIHVTTAIAYAAIALTYLGLIVAIAMALMPKRKEEQDDKA